MIELDIVTYMNNDATLASLLIAEPGDTHIYPIQSPHTAITNIETKIHIIYGVLTEGTFDENLLELTMQLSARAQYWSDVNAVVDRIYALFDRQDDIRNQISSVDYYIYWSKVVGGASFKEPEMDLFTRAMNIEFKYHLKNRIV